MTSRRKLTPLPLYALDTGWITLLTDTVASAMKSTLFVAVLIASLATFSLALPFGDPSAAFSFTVVQDRSLNREDAALIKRVLASQGACGCAISQSAMMESCPAGSKAIGSSCCGHPICSNGARPTKPDFQGVTGALKQRRSFSFKREPLDSLSKGNCALVKCAMRNEPRPTCSGGEEPIANEGCCGTSFRCPSSQKSLLGGASETLNNAKRQSAPGLLIAAVHKDLQKRLTSTGNTTHKELSELTSCSCAYKPAGPPPTCKGGAEPTQSKGACCGPRWSCPDGQEEFKLPSTLVGRDLAAMDGLEELEARQSSGISQSPPASHPPRDVYAAEEGADVAPEQFERSTSVVKVESRQASGIGQSPPASHPPRAVIPSDADEESKRAELGKSADEDLSSILANFARSLPNGETTPVRRDDKLSSLRTDPKLSELSMTTCGCKMETNSIPPTCKGGVQPVASSGCCGTRYTCPSGA
ncbi:hypothetical protein IE81DRAFT_189859 [Ceraceosorus guamensis]|uniref:Uncharacterized protein n=1 Tax=Ceraceosorus guamensis TaxID=1522189 RepID=A0A316WCY4_9BASI|nr:hypothetical protein IE81DRAFT_189859 [Ceraceosorus guamensis]PWN45395.1 hypothetical protein IE81DRAFT_189859 [Ceraceosorus guamensis]